MDQELQTELKVWRHIEKSDSVNWCKFTWRTIVPKFIPILFQTTDPTHILPQQEEQQQDDPKITWTSYMFQPALK